jgi:hypothetical protein
MARLIDAAPTRQDDGAWRVPTGGARADLVFLDRATLAGRYPGAAIDALADEGAAALVLRVADLARAREALEAVPVLESPSGGIVVPADRASGLMLVFEQA